MGKPIQNPKIPSRVKSTFKVRLRSDMDELLRQDAEKSGKFMSDIIDEALRQYYKVGEVGAKGDDNTDQDTQGNMG